MHPSRWETGVVFPHTPIVSASISAARNWPSFLYANICTHQFLFRSEEWGFNPTSARAKTMHEQGIMFILQHHRKIVVSWVFARNLGKLFTTSSEFPFRLGSGMCRGHEPPSCGQSSELQKDKPTRGRLMWCCLSGPPKRHIIRVRGWKMRRIPSCY